LGVGLEWKEVYGWAGWMDGLIELFINCSLSLSLTAAALYNTYLTYLKEDITTTCLTTLCNVYVVV